MKEPILGITKENGESIRELISFDKIIASMIIALPQPTHHDPGYGIDLSLYTK